MLPRGETPLQWRGKPVPAPHPGRQRPALRQRADHLGHLVESLQTGIRARCRRLRGEDCTYVCADDAHGTPIMLLAQQRGISPEQRVEETGRQHREDFADFA